MEMKNNLGFLFGFWVFHSCFCCCVEAGFHRRQSIDPLNFILGNQNLSQFRNGILGQALAPGLAPNGARIPLILAGNRTKRPDILRRFKTYEGGWDISNKHYWASVGFTGMAGFVLATIWLISFSVALLLHHCFAWRINFKGKRSKYSQKIRPILLILFTCASTVGCILLSVGQDKFHSEVFQTLNYVVNQSDYTAQMLKNVTDYLSLAKTVNVPQFTLPENAMRDIDQLSDRLSSGADTLTQKTNENSVQVRKIFNAIRLVLITVAVVMLLLVFVGLVLSLLRRQHAIHIFIFSGWILVAVTLILCGTFVIFNSAISDSCIAMQEWVDNPQAETALSHILPCVDEGATNQTLFQSRSVVSSLVNYINTFVYTGANTNRPPSDQFYYNQSGPLMPPLCYPFDDKMQDRECYSQEVPLTNASVVWAEYICATSSDNKNCTSPGRLTPYLYGQLVLAVNASYAVLHYTPEMLDLQNCNFVRETVVTINSRFCPHLERDLLVVEVGLGLISAGIVLCLIVWLVYANRPQREEAFVNLSSLIKHGQGGDREHTGVSMVNVVVTSPARVVPHEERYR